jgi:hypothetical protein
MKTAPVTPYLVTPYFGALGFFILFTFAAICLPAQTGIPFNQRDDQYVLLGLKRAKEMYEVSRTEYERAQLLHAQGMSSDAALDLARRNLADTEVNYQQSLLAVLFEQQYVAVIGAVKYQAGDGAKHVRLQLQNTSRGGEEFHQLVSSDEELFQLLQPDVIHNVYVSLLNNENAIIGQPYESKISALVYGEPVTLDFGLLQDLDSVTVNLLYGNGSTRAVRIYLQKDSSVDRVLLQSEQFSQEAELGGSASFGLDLELFSGSNDTFRLAVVNLPSEVNRYFVDPATQARLRQLRFTESSRTRRAALRIFLPDRPTDEFVMDRAIAFYVLAIPDDRTEELVLSAEKTLTEAEILDLGVGFARLELVPRGVGRLMVRAPQLYHSSHAGESLSMTLEVVNEGTRRLDNVEVTAAPPHGWQKTITPAVVPALEIGEEKTVELIFEIPDDMPVGSYEVRVRTTSFADEKPIEGEDKNVTVRVQARASIAAPAILILLLLGIITAVVVVGIRIAKR